MMMDENLWLKVKEAEKEVKEAEKEVDEAKIKVDEAGKMVDELKKQRDELVDTEKIEWKNQEIRMAQLSWDTFQKNWDSTQSYLNTLRKVRNNLLEAAVKPPSGAPQFSLEQLILSQFPKMKLDKSVLRRMNLYFSAQVLLALSTNDAVFAADTYAMTEKLPLTETINDLNVHGYIVSGPLFDGSGLVLCFKESKTCILKPLNFHEEQRITEFNKNAVAEELRKNNIITFELYRREYKSFMIMPKLSSTLQDMPSLSLKTATRLWEDVSRALKFIHSKGFCHMDVKPSNICNNENGDFILIDLGSIIPMKMQTQSTRAFLPVDLINTDSPKGYPVVDWWMFAMTLAGRFNSGRLMVINKEDLLRFLERKLYPSIFILLQNEIMNASEYGSVKQCVPRENFYSQCTSFIE